MCQPAVVLSSTSFDDIPPMVSAAAPAAAINDHRRRLLDAMSHVVARKGYADATIADLAAEARVSRRTFYEHFDTKAECLIALYEVASDQALNVLKAAIDPARDWHTQVEQAQGPTLRSNSSHAGRLPRFSSFSSSSNSSQRSRLAFFLISSISAAS